MNHEISHDSLTEDSLTENNLQQKIPQPPKQVSLVILSVILLTGLGLIGIYAGSAKLDTVGKERKSKQPTLVTVAMVTQKTVPIQLQAIGNVQSGSTVAVTPQASGRIMKVHFQKGQ